MSEPELRQLLAASQSPNDRATALILGKLDELKDETKLFRRTLFGEENVHPGLTKRVESLEKHRAIVTRCMIYGGAVVTGIGLFWDEIKKKIFGS